MSKHSLLCFREPQNRNKLTMKTEKAGLSELVSWVTCKKWPHGTKLCRPQGVWNTSSCSFHYGKSVLYEYREFWQILIKSSIFQWAIYFLSVKVLLSMDMFSTADSSLPCISFHNLPGKLKHCFWNLWTFV